MPLACVIDEFFIARRQSRAHLEQRKFELHRLCQELAAATAELASFDRLMLRILEEEGVAPEAFIWVHAQAEKDLSHHVNAARGGAWISLDGVSKDNLDEYIEMIRNLKAHNLLDKTLISHDAGWYSPGEENGGDYRGHTAVFEHLVL